MKRTFVSLAIGLLVCLVVILQRWCSRPFSLLFMCLWVQEVYTDKIIGGSNLQLFSQNNLNDGIIGWGILFVLQILSFLNNSWQPMLILSTLHPLVPCCYIEVLIKKILEILEFDGMEASNLHRDNNNISNSIGTGGKYNEDGLGEHYCDQGRPWTKAHRAIALGATCYIYFRGRQMLLESLCLSGLAAVQLVLW
ncbi:hypothetical protein F2Q69_00047759 [Brassica cretica]|uniref:Uncharacterized protein n=1 Tax=Brassica cretica TaxID=69181 RepID=A0A8S9PUT9_BRACR|nr:hypothetical protein F2Q69_00047759 [Brassica cretica]